MQCETNKSILGQWACYQIFLKQFASVWGLRPATTCNLFKLLSNDLFALALRMSNDMYCNLIHRQLEGEVAEEWNVENMDKLLPLVQDIIQFDMKHSAEIQACDLLMEIDRLDLLTQHMDQSNYTRVCLYLIGYVFCFFFISSILSLTFKPMMRHLAASCNFLKILLVGISTWLFVWRPIVSI